MTDEIISRLSSIAGVKQVEINKGEIELSVDVLKETFTLTFSVNKPFPQKLPKIYIKDAGKHGLIPHVCWEGEICYNDGIGITIDVSDPCSVAVYSVEKAIEVLEKKDTDDFYDEFEGYWNKQDSCKVAVSLIGDSEVFEHIKVNSKKDDLPIAYLPVGGENIPNSHYSHYKYLSNNGTQNYGYHLPLDRTISPPLAGESIHISVLEDISAAMSDNNRDAWRQCIDAGCIPQRRLHLLISQPRPSGGRSFFGLTVPFARKALEDNDLSSYKHQIIPITILHHTRDYLLRRSGASLSLANYKFAVVGCGSVGSRIAEYLALSGAEDISLFDGDKYSTDNIYRHILDSKYVGHDKSKSLALQLEERIPYLQVSPFVQYIDVSFDMTGYDVVIDAAGDPTLSRKLNQAHRLLHGDKPMLLSVWLEAMGLGGHSILSDGSSVGCLHCLYDNDGSDTLINKFSFIESGQRITKNLTGCGGAFIQFGAIDASRTAEMAVRQLLQAIESNQEAQNGGYVCWCGDDQLARNERVSTTSWYNKIAKKGADKIPLTIGCSICTVRT